MKKLVMLGVSLIALTAAARASAETYVITYTGHVAGANDGQGIFGPAPLSPNDPLYVSLPFTAQFAFTSPTPGATVSTSSDPSGFGSTTITGDNGQNPLNGTLTINGHTFQFYPNSGRVTQTNGFFNDWRVDSVRLTDNDSSDGFVARDLLDMQVSSGPNMVSSIDPTMPFSYTLRPGDYGGGTFQILHTYNGVRTYASGTLMTSESRLLPHPFPSRASGR